MVFNILTFGFIFLPVNLLSQVLTTVNFCYLSKKKLLYSKISWN